MRQVLQAPITSLLLSFILTACVSAPSAPLAPSQPDPVSPLVSSSGLVIGTLSYQYLETDARRAPPSWVVYFERLDRTAGVKDYALAVNVDPANQSGVFTGALPAGVYTFREAQSANRRFAPGALKMPFEVMAGSVQDAGHYALNPLLTH